MTDVGTVVTRKKHPKRLPPVDSDYKPHSRPQLHKRSPYPTRPAEDKPDQEVELEEDVSGDERQEECSGLEGVTQVGGEISEDEGMARKEEGELSSLMRYMMERDERREVEERRRREEREERERERRREDEDRQREFMRVEAERRREENLERRRAEEERKDLKELQQEKMRALGSYKEGTELSDYLCKFERLLKECKVDEGSWSERLYPRLPERLCARVAAERDGEMGYSVVKQALLQTVGETTLTYGRNLFELSGEGLKHLAGGDACEHIVKTCRGVLQGCETLEQCVVALATAVTRRVLPQPGKVYMETKPIKSLKELREMWETWVAGRQKGNFYKPWLGEVGSERRGFRGDVREGYGGREITCFSCGGKGHRAGECKDNKGRTGFGSRTEFRPEPRTITCFTCGKPGHRSTECASKKVGAPLKREGGKVATVIVGEKKDNIAWGRVNGTECKVLVDSGASVGVVPKSLLEESYRDCGEIQVANVHGGRRAHRSTIVKFEVGGLVRSHLAMIDEREGEGVICIVPLNLRDREEAAAYAKAIEEYGSRSQKTETEEPKVNMLTRSQARIEAELDECEEDAGVKDLWCTVELSDEASGDEVELEPPTSWEEEGPEQVRSRESEVEEDLELEGEPKALGSVTANQGEKEFDRLAREIGPMERGKDGKEFREKLLTDDSLKTWRELGTRRERGFKWDRELLLRGMYVSWEEFVDVIVVPKEFRSRILEMAHERCGHLGGGKVAKLVSRYFLWPGMVKDVEDHCKGCEICQRKSKAKPSRAPAVERPVLTEPFESVAVDLVGPLPKGKGGCRFLLTYVCMATRWPEAVPLRSITARSVADQFCGRVVKQLCELLGVEKLRTSPYHPQTNGMVERMHGMLKGVLGRCIEDRVDWVGLVPLALYVLRQMPHADSGFSPFDVVFGFRVRTPLDALYHGIFEVEGKERNVCDWVSGRMDRLERMRDCAALGMNKGREGRMNYLNRGCKMRTFEEGDLVLYRIPGMSCKLADSWEGPFSVLCKMGSVNYKIGKVGNVKHAKVVHVYCLKKYRERTNIRRLDLVLEDAEQERNVLREECVGFVKGDLEDLMGEFGDVFSDVPGNTDRVKMTIDTGDSPPIRLSPYSVPMGIRDEVKAELDGLLECGVIERSRSCWSSPLVPVKKVGGGIRLCVDYRKLNEVTVKEPYYIPGLEEMMERVGSGRVLSKVDLAKGFHQVEVVSEDREKTCFVCPFGKYQYRRMPFGLANAPSVFQRLMDEVLVECVDFAKVYIDDVLVVSGCWEVHVMHLRKLFGVLKEAGLTCKRSKCVFGKRKLEFLGHVIGDGSMKVPEARIKAIAEHPVPKTRKQLRAFLGLIGYYRRFVRGFHRWSSLLTSHTAKTSPGEVLWTSPMLEAFRKLCVSLCDHVCLNVPCKEDEFCLESDASASGIGAVLSVRRDEEWKPVAFFSRQLKGAQVRYSAQELEGLALFEAVQHFAFYLYGKRFSIITDHRGLEWLKSGKQKNRRVYGWALKLSEFQFDVTYRRGDHNVVADDLSRCHDGSNVGVTVLSKEEGGDVGQPTFKNTDS